MSNLKFNFNEDGTVEKEENYQLTDEEIDAILEDNIEYDEDDEDDEEDDNKNIINTNRYDSLEKKPKKSNKKIGRQMVHESPRGNDALRRTYIMEIENLKKLDEIKLIYHENPLIQYSEIVNEAIDFYYSQFKK